MTPAHLQLALAGSHLAAGAVSREGARRGVLLVLGCRYLGQAYLLRRPTRARRRAVAAADALHGLTAVAWAVRGPRDRLLGALSAGLSTAAVVLERPRP